MWIAERPQSAAYVSIHAFQRHTKQLNTHNTHFSFIVDGIVLRTGVKHICKNETKIIIETNSWQVSGKRSKTLCRRAHSSYSHNIIFIAFACFRIIFYVNKRCNLYIYHINGFHQPKKLKRLWPVQNIYVDYMYACEQIYCTGANKYIIYRSPYFSLPHSFCLPIYLSINVKHLKKKNIYSTIS